MSSAEVVIPDQQNLSGHVTLLPVSCASCQACLLATIGSYTQLNLGVK